MSAPRPTGWRLWRAAVRPRTLTLAVAPLPPAAALAWSQAHALHPPSLLAALVGAVAIQAGTNLWNDAADAASDRRQRLGPARVTAMDWASPAQVRRAALLAFAVAALAGLFLAWRGGTPILALGIAALVAGWGYSCGPRPISHTPLGEIFVLAFFGIGAVAGTVWLQAGALVPGTLPLGIALGLPAAAVLMVNNARDRAEDARAGRRTLAIVLGVRGSVWAYGALMLAPFALLPLVPGAWGGLLAAPWAAWLVKRFAEAEGAALNSLLAATARCQLAMAVLAAGGMA